MRLSTVIFVGVLLCCHLSTSYAKNFGDEVAACVVEGFGPGLAGDALEDAMSKCTVQVEANRKKERELQLVGKSRRSEYATAEQANKADVKENPYLKMIEEDESRRKAGAANEYDLAVSGVIQTEKFKDSDFDALAKDNNENRPILVGVLILASLVALAIIVYLFRLLSAYAVFRAFVFVWGQWFLLVFLWKFIWGRSYSFDDSEFLALIASVPVMTLVSYFGFKWARRAG